MGDQDFRRLEGELPVALTSFVGRRQEISKVCRRLSAARLLTMTGVGGVGKTRLALEVAAEFREVCADEVKLVDLSAVQDEALVEHTVATNLGVPHQPGKPTIEQIADHLARRRLLMVLDNCEHLVDACAVLSDRLLRVASGLRILATSRRTLGIAGEHVFTVPPLSFPDPDVPSPPEELARYEAVALLLDRATAMQPDFQITKSNAPAVARLCACLDGLPLAIELAASRLRSLPVEEIAARLEDRFALLTGGSRTALPRQRTLRAMIDWSHDLCSPAERLLWRRLSVFTGPFCLDAAEGVCAGDGLSQADILDLIDQLLAQSLLLPGPSADGSEGEHRGPRYQMLETIRHYGSERLSESGEENRLHSRHRDYYLGLAQRSADSWCGPGQEAALARLRTEQSNLRAALGWSTRHGETHHALELVLALRYFWCADGFLNEGRCWLDLVLRLSEEPTEARAKALCAAAWTALLLGDHTAADLHLDTCEKLIVQLGGSPVHGWMISLRGTSALFQGRPAEAEALFEQAVAEQEQSGDEAGLPLSLLQHSLALAEAGDERAAVPAESALRITESRGERWARSYALLALGYVAWRRGELNAAAELTRTGLQIQRGFSDHVGTALMIEVLAWISAEKDENLLAGRLLGVARSLWRSVNTDAIAFRSHDTAARCERVVAGALDLDGLGKTMAEGRDLDDPVRAIAYVLDGPLMATASATGRPLLTTREHEVARLVTQGLTNRRIADVLVLSTRTVDGHVARILAKLGFVSRTQVAAWYVEHQSTLT